jgi:NAD(P)-dependent dehydrogenase (short-subunit alcohol dehydrogenase family)
MELVETGIHATVVCPAGVLTEWAAATEGSPMLPFFSQTGPVIKAIASERGIALPAIEGVLSADEVARQIVQCVYAPVPELFTHRGSEEFLRSLAENRAEAEKRQIPVVLGEREVYERTRRTPADPV